MKSAYAFLGFVLICCTLVEAGPRRVNITTTTEGVVENSTVRVRRQRLRTTTVEPVTEEGSKSTTERGRRRFRNRTEQQSGQNVTNDGVVSPSEQRVLIKPNSTVYNFETGRLSRRGRTTVAPVVEKNEEGVVEQATVLKPKRYSSRYSGKTVVTSTTEAVDSEPAFAEKVEDEESPVDYKEEQKKSGEGGNKETKGGGEEHHADQHSVKGTKDSKGYEGGHKFHKV